MRTVFSHLNTVRKSVCMKIYSVAFNVPVLSEMLAKRLFRDFEVRIFRDT